MKSIDDQDEYTLVSDSDIIDVTDNYPNDSAYYKIMLKEMPVTSKVYKPRYFNDLYDPIRHPRYSIRPSVLADLLKAEKECVKDLYTICVDLRNYIGPRLPIVSWRAMRSICKQRAKGELIRRYCWLQKQLRVDQPYRLSGKAITMAGVYE